MAGTINSNNLFDLPKQVHRQAVVSSRDIQPEEDKFDSAMFSSELNQRICKVLDGVQPLCTCNIFLQNHGV